MENLQRLAQPLQRMINSIGISQKLEVAVFDNEAQLVCCTPLYAKKKGKAVHAPSIQEVLHYGSVVVNTPGQMPSCLGCRFRDNCPSTMEMLACIKANGIVAGVVAITSFTKGYSRISSNQELYLETVSEIALMLGNFLASKSASATSIQVDDMIQGILKVATSPMLVTDANGVITQYNQMAEASLKFCQLSASSLWHIIPENLAKKALRGVEFREKEFVKDGYHAKFTSTQITSGDAVAAIVVRLTDDYYVDAAEETTSLDRIVGNTPQARFLHHLIRKVAGSPSPVLITGETGTGKELVARAIHENSSRSRYPFVAVNCSGIPETLFESELFGYAEGSFTGAKKGGKMGKFEMAQGGTIFLDELGEMPLSMQPKLLRVLQEYELERVGSTEKIPLNIRVVAATNRDLEEMMEKGTFRKDLYYRICVLNVEIPSLRERKDDIMPIAMSYLQRLKHTLNTPVTGFSPEVEEIFRSYPWVGNIRELQNAVEYAANLGEQELVTVKDLPKRLLIQRAAPNSRPSPARESTAGGAQAESEKQQITRLLDQYGYTLEGKRLIAQELDVSLRTLYRKMEKYQLS